MPRAHQRAGLRDKEMMARKTRSNRSKKIVVSLLVVALTVMGSGFLWARAVFTGDAVRSALAAQLAKAIGQPVTIGEISASAFPRVEIRLGDVAIGSPVRVRLPRLRVRTGRPARPFRRVAAPAVTVD